MMQATELNERTIRIIYDNFALRESPHVQSLHCVFRADESSARRDCEAGRLDGRLGRTAHTRAVLCRGARG